MLFEDRVKKYEYKLNDTDDMITAYIIKYKPEIVNISIKDLAAKFFTVPNTIVRLAKKLDYSGFVELKNAIKAELSEADYIEYDNQRYGHNINIQKTLDLIDYQLLDKLSTLIVKSHTTLIFTLGDNIRVTQGVIKEASLMAHNIEFCTYPHDTRYKLEFFTPQDVLFLISFSGYKPEVLEFAKIAKEKGAQVIALTHFSENELQKLADYSLYCFSPPLVINNFNMIDKTPLLLVLRALTENIWRKTGLY